MRVWHVTEAPLNSSFAPKRKIQWTAKAYSLDCIDFARKQFKLTLDWSDASVQHIETMLDQFHSEFDSAQPSEDQILQFAKLFGSYVGEVFRRNHGATWGIMTLDGNSFPGLKAARDGAEFWPFGRVRNRLVNGPEDNVWHYYRVLVAEHGSDGESRPYEPSPVPKGSLWQAIRGAFHKAASVKPRD
jgi:hypothetical protein